MVMQICKTAACEAVRQSCELGAPSVGVRFATFLRQPCNKHGKETSYTLVYVRPVLYIEAEKSFSNIMQNSEKTKM